MSRHGVNVMRLSDNELIYELERLGAEVGPITDTTRTVYQKKLLKLLGNSASVTKSSGRARKSNLATTRRRGTTLAGGEDVEHLTDDELIGRLEELGVEVGPVTDTTRTVYQRKLLKLLDSHRPYQAASAVSDRGLKDDDYEFDEDEDDDFVNLSHRGDDDDGDDDDHDHDVEDDDVEDDGYSAYEQKERSSLHPTTTTNIARNWESDRPRDILRSEYSFSTYSSGSFSHSRDFLSSSDYPMSLDSLGSDDYVRSRVGSDDYVRSRVGSDDYMRSRVGSDDYIRSRGDSVGGFQSSNDYARSALARPPLIPDRDLMMKDRQAAAAAKRDKPSSSSCPLWLQFIILVTLSAALFLILQNFVTISSWPVAGWIEQLSAGNAEDNTAA